MANKPTRSKVLSLRSAADWERIIHEKVPAEAQIKVACTVFWDFSVSKHFAMSGWFRTMLDEYTRSDELDREVLVGHLKEIGYTKKMTDRLLKISWWDNAENLDKQKQYAERTAMRQKEKRNEEAKHEDVHAEAGHQPDQPAQEPDPFRDRLVRGGDGVYRAPVLSGARSRY